MGGRPHPVLKQLPAAVYFRRRDVNGRGGVAQEKEMVMPGGQRQHHRQADQPAIAME